MHTLGPTSSPVPRQQHSSQPTLALSCSKQHFSARDVCTAPTSLLTGQAHAFYDAPNRVATYHITATQSLLECSPYPSRAMQSDGGGWPPPPILCQSQPMPQQKYSDSFTQSVYQTHPPCEESFPTPFTRVSTSRDAIPTKSTVRTTLPHSKELPEGGQRAVTDSTHTLTEYSSYQRSAKTPLLCPDGTKETAGTERWLKPQGMITYTHKRMAGEGLANVHDKLCICTCRTRWTQSTT